MIRSLEVIGEAAGDSVAEIIGMRHRLIHGYAEVRLDLVWMVARERLAPLVSALEPLIPKEGASSE